MDWVDIGLTQLLIVVDSGSGWIEAFPSSNRLSSTIFRDSILANYLRPFRRPSLLDLSDNAPEFVSEELNEWLMRQGIKKLESPKYFPEANGLAEWAVRTVKTALATWKGNKQKN